MPVGLEDRVLTLDGGIHLFGRRFGHYPQDLVLWLGYRSTGTNGGGS